MPYLLVFSRAAEDELAALDRPVARRIRRKLNWFAENFERLNRKALTGNWQGRFAYRIGPYRVIYTFDLPNRSILIHSVDNRSTAYC